MIQELVGLAMQLVLPWAPLPPEATLLFAGDAMQHAAQLEAARRPDGTYDYSECFSAIAPYIGNADYAVVNLETPIGNAPYTGYPCFNAPPSFAASLRDAGFDLFLTANNHTLDRRDNGLVRTAAILDTLGVDHIGTYPTAATRDSVIPFIREINTFKVGFLNYTYGTNGFTPGEETTVDYIDRAAIARDIHKTRDAGAEILCVAIHWGDEYNLLPNKRQRELAEWMREEGVDLIIGSHPHVIQPMEMHIDPQDSLARSLTVYSLGNFISNMKTRDTRGGVMVKVELIRDLRGRARVHRASYAPVFTVPATRDFNFHLIDATTEAPAAVEPQRNDFLKSAQSIFDRHNIGVARDTAVKHIINRHNNKPSIQYP